MNPAAQDALLQACGVGGPLTVLVTGPTENARRQVLVERGFVVVGSHPQASVVLEDHRVASRHFYLQPLGGHLYAVDLASRRGVFHGVTRFTTGWVSEGSFFRIGPYHLSVRYTPAGSPLPPVPTDDPITHRSTDPKPFPDLEADILVGNVRRSRWKMTRRLVLVGRDPLARLRLRDRSVSRFHAALVGTPQGVWVVDLLSREGTWINGTRILSHVRLRSGDRMRIGCYDLYVQVEGPVSGLSLPAPAPAPVAVPNMGRALILPGATGLSPTAGQAALTPEASTLLPILQQFGMFQQQMLDQFQQSLMMMLQTFAQVNGEQMGLIREELAELRRLTAELNEARQQLGSAPADPAPAEAPATGGAANTVRIPPTAQTAATTSPASLEGPPDVDVHAWLSGQIANLESRREGLLKRILRKVTGG